MLLVISKQVLPAYARLAHFIEVTYIPAGRAEPGIWAIPDGGKYYQFLIQHTTTTDLKADQIHSCGADPATKAKGAQPLGVTVEPAA